MFWLFIKYFISIISLIVFETEGRCQILCLKKKKKTQLAERETLEIMKYIPFIFVFTTITGTE